MANKTRYIELAKDLILKDLTDEEIDASVDEVDRCWLGMSKDERNEAEHIVMRIIGDAVSGGMPVAQE